MTNITTLYGAALVLIGLVGYLATGMVSATALIPSGFGVLFLGIALVSRKEHLKKHAMHAAVLLALLVIGGTFKGFAKLPQLLAGAELERPAAVAAQSITALLTLGFIFLCVKSFIAARRNS